MSKLQPLKKMIFGTNNKLNFMKKNLLYLFLFLMCNISVYSQNDVKARIEFEEAEKAFNDKDYSTSLQKLIEAEKLLGKTNTKILYLKVICQNETIKSEPFDNFEMLVDIRQNCDMFMKMTDKKPDMYDKYKEVYKIKKDLELYPKSITDFNIKKEEYLIEKKNVLEKENEAAREKKAFTKDLFERVNFTFEPDKSLDYYTSKYPEINTFIKKSKKTKNGDKTTYTFKLGFGRVFGKLFRVELSDITTRNDKVVYVSYTLMTGKNNETENISNEYQKLVRLATKFYGSQPIIKPEYGLSTVYVESKELPFYLYILYSYQSYDSSCTLHVGFYTDEMELSKWK